MVTSRVPGWRHCGILVCRFAGRCSQRGNRGRNTVPHARQNLNSQPARNSFLHIFRQVNFFQSSLDRFPECPEVLLDLLCRDKEFQCGILEKFSVAITERIAILAKSPVPKCRRANRIVQDHCTHNVPLLCQTSLPGTFTTLPCIEHSSKHYIFSGAGIPSTHKPLSIVSTNARTVSSLCASNSPPMIFSCA